MSEVPLYAFTQPRVGVRGRIGSSVGNSDVEGNSHVWQRDHFSGVPAPRWDALGGFFYVQPYIDVLVRCFFEVEA